MSEKLFKYLNTLDLISPEAGSLIFLSLFGLLFLCFAYIFIDICIEIYKAKF